MKTKTPITLALAACAFGMVSAVKAETFSVEVTNLTNGSYFTPLLLAAHPASADVFEVGQTASAQVVAMAEGGDTSGLAALLGGLGVDLLDNPAAGPLGPGATASGTLETTSTGNTQLSIVAMILPSNDAFIGLDSATLPTSGSAVYYLNGYDAGSEANDEIVGSGAPGEAGFPNPPFVTTTGTGGTGLTDNQPNTHIHIHRGVLGDTDSNAGASDIDSQIHRWLNPVARVVVIRQ